MRPIPLPVAVLLAVALAAAGCHAPAAPPAVRLQHVVLFRLDDPGDADELIAACDALAGRIPGVVACHAGRPLDLGRETVEGDFDVGLVLGFAAVADYEAYLVHPDHVAIGRAWRPRLESMRAFDVLDASP